MVQHLHKVYIASCFMGVSIVKCKMDVVQEVEREDLVAISQVGLITLLQRLHSAQLNL